MELQLNAAYRGETGKGAVHRLRRDGQIPAVLYRQGRESLPLAVDAKSFSHLYAHGGLNRLIKLSVTGSVDSGSSSVLIREIQREPIHGKPLHMDFVEVALDHAVEVQVPLVLGGERLHDGSIIEQLLHEVTVRCLPAEIPERIEVDLSGLHRGGNILVKDIMAPRGAKIMTDPEEPVVLAEAPTAALETPLAEAPARGKEM